jgi:hypothetical protein
VPPHPLTRGWEGPAAVPVGRAVPVAAEEEAEESKAEGAVLLVVPGLGAAEVA